MAGQRSLVMPDARVGQQRMFTRIWAKRGTRPRAPRDTRYRWAFAGSLEPAAFTGLLLGAVGPARGAAVGLVLPFVSPEAMNAHMAEISRNVAAFVGKTIRRMVYSPPHPMPG
jgi:hypothetical protein